MPRKSKTVVVRGSVLLIASLFAVSAMLRILTSAESALAEIGTADGFALPVAAEPAKPNVSDRSRTEMASLLEALRAREASVVERETDLDIRAKALDVAQIEIERRLDALEAAENRLESTLAVAQSASENDLARLTTVYENMKPKDAAALFEAMEPEFAAGFIARMRPDAAAKERWSREFGPVVNPHFPSNR
ncbi:MotE family protein [Tateyamaria sp.]|uniref:MotE family protein n=1 Tax=Tateyamaria sp. TaxID=1929288 RepID=UPI003B217AB9